MTFIVRDFNLKIIASVAVNLVEAEAVEIGVTGSRPARSKPVNMPHAASKPLMPVVIDGSGSECILDHVASCVCEEQNLLNIVTLLIDYFCHL